MSVQRKKTRLELLQEETDKRQFIKSYPVLNKITQISPTDKQLIELVLSYQDNEQPFKMGFGSIADLLGVSDKTVSNIVLKLSGIGIVLTNHKKNNVVDGVGRGSSTDLTIDLDRVVELLKSPAEPKAPRKTRTKKPASTTEPIQEPEPAPAVEVEKPAPTPAEPIEPVTPAPTNQKKALMIERYKAKFRYSKAGNTMTPAEFHSLTDNRFIVLPRVTSRLLSLPADNFDVFWDKVQELKKDLLEFEQAQQ